MRLMRIKCSWGEITVNEEPKDVKPDNRYGPALMLRAQLNWTGETVYLTKSQAKRLGERLIKWSKKV